MKNFNFEKFIKDAKSVKLIPEEKMALLNYLKNKMITEPVALPAGRQVRNPVFPGHNIWSINNFKLTFTKPMPIAIIIALLIGGGVSAAAQNSLPGDALFPIKVSVNEKIQGFLAISDEAEAKLQTKLAEKRLEEAEKLATEDDFKEDVRVRLEENFEKHADKVRVKIAELEAKNTPKALEIASNLENSLNVHARILKNLETNLDGNVRPELKKLEMTVEAKKNKINDERDDKENKFKREAGPAVQAAAEGKLEAVENKLAEVRKFIDRHNADLDADAKAKVEARLSLAQDMLAQGKAKMEAKAYAEAFLLFQKAHRMLQEVKLLLTAKMELEEKTPAPTPSPKVTSSPQPSVSGNVETKVKVREESGEHQNEFHERVKIDLGL